MNITVVDDNNTHHYFPNVSLEVGAAVMHALSGEIYNAATGACMCTSFSQDVSNGADCCISCRHAAHNTRVFCGAMR